MRRRIHGHTVPCCPAQGQDVIFMETAMHLQNPHSHATVECIPVSPGVAVKAPIFFKKGLDDAESEWSQHHAKRMIETGAKVRHMDMSVHL